MIVVLTRGMRVRLPSGNVVVLVRRERASWVCEFAQGSAARGETEFTGAWLRKFGREQKTTRIG